jgi:hypothetical protein
VARVPARPGSLTSVASHSELMRLHIEALFVHDAEQCMVRVNEPNGALAPRFFLGRTSDGIITRVRYDDRPERQGGTGSGIEGRRARHRGARFTDRSNTLRRDSRALGTCRECLDRTRVLFSAGVASECRCHAHHGS